LAAVVQISRQPAAAAEGRTLQERAIRSDTQLTRGWDAFPLRAAGGDGFFDMTERADSTRTCPADPAEGLAQAF